MSGPRVVSPLERIGFQKARRAMAGRLAAAIVHILDGVGCTLTVTIQEGDGDPKTGSVPFSTWAYLAWNDSLKQQDIHDQEQIAIAHISETIAAMERQLEKHRQHFEALQAVNAKMSEQLADDPKENPS